MVGSVAVVHIIVSVSGISIPGKGFFFLPLVIAQLETGNFIVVVPDDKIHFTVGKPPPVSFSRNLTDVLYFIKHFVPNRNQTLFGDQSENYSVLYQEPETAEDWATGHPKKAVAADVDGDELDEVVIAVYYLATEELALRIVDYDAAGTTAREVNRVTISGVEDTLTGTAGGSGEANSALVGEYIVFDDLVTEPQMISPLHTGDIQTTAEATTFYLFAADVATGDFDGDGLPETAFSGRRPAGGHMLFVLDTSMNSNSEPDFSFVPSIGIDNYETGPQYYVTGVAAGDIDGDGKDKIATYQDIYVVDGTDIEYHGIYENEALIVGAHYSENYPLLDTMRVGDVTGDKKEDVLFVTNDSDQIYIISTNTAGELTLKEDFFVKADPTNVTIEAEVQAGTVIAGSGVGYQYGYSYSTSVTTGTYIEGEVPDIPENKYDSDMRFRWGLMAYPRTHQGQQFTIVTYWADN